MDATDSGSGEKAGNGNEGSRHWGEEVEEDAVWGVYLKKVRYQRPSSIVQIVQASGGHGGADVADGKTDTTNRRHHRHHNNHNHHHQRHQGYNHGIANGVVGSSGLAQHVLVYNHQPLQINSKRHNNKKYSNASTSAYPPGVIGNTTTDMLEAGKDDSESDNEEDEIAHLMWETVKIRVLRAGSLKKIIEAIANEDSDVQATHLSVFLATYRAFASPPEVIHEIINIYRTTTSDILKRAMLDCLNVWLDSYSEDFEQGADGYDCLRKLILPFAQEETLTSLGLKIQYKLRARRKMKKSVSVHSLRTYSPLNIKVYSLQSIPETHFAQQLTYADKELFLNLRVWECLGGLWKRRCGCGSVIATVEQFNGLSGRVVATILLDGLASLHHRAKIVDKWIRIAQELRYLKNFSSLKAIISALESNPIFRLSKVWQLITKEKLTIFSQLSQIFSEENNRLAQRSILEIEGTAKTASVSSPRNPKDNKNRFFSKGNKSAGSTGTLTRDGKRGGTGFSVEYDTPNGTIPYLGTFLTDLTFIDSAIPDRVRDNLHNFDKRRKEFEVLAQLKLLQGSAKSYRIEEDPYFIQWFNSLMVLDDKAAYELSLAIQPEKPSAKGHRKNDSYASNSSSEAIDGPLQRKGSIPSSNESSSMFYTNNSNMNGTIGSTSITTRHSAGSNNSGSNSLLSPSSSTNNISGTTKSHPSPSTSRSPSQSKLAIVPPETSIVVKVSSPSNDAIMYKSILIGNSDHTIQVINQALEKLDLQPNDPKKYNLVQILPHKELKFPINANIFYALDTSSSAPGDIRLEVRAVSSNLTGAAPAKGGDPSLNNNNSYNLPNNNKLSPATSKYMNGTTNSKSF